MATQKQRRKRAKEKRHAYDLVEIDGEGNETVLTASELKVDAPPRAQPKKGETRSAPKSKFGRGAPQPPTWGRVLKRGAIFAPIFLATVLLLAGNRLTFAGAVVQTGSGRFIEVQGTAETEPFDRAALDALLGLAEHGISQLVARQRAIVGLIAEGIRQALGAGREIFAAIDVEEHDARQQLAARGADLALQLLGRHRFVVPVARDGRYGS